MSRLFNHLADVVETANGGFDMTRRGRQYFNRFLRQHGKALRDIKTHAALIEALKECNDADFAAARRRMQRAPDRGEEGQAVFPGRESRQRLVA